MRYCKLIIFDNYDIFTCDLCTICINLGKRDTYIEIKKRIPHSPNPDYAPLIFDQKDVKAPNEPIIRQKVNSKL